ncbi:MAG TPA: Ig-like domain-containing protein, partial [Chloroflexota bacterium]|nr:Ig-like domain-containing protein [Chloroflexota bacterium]
AWVVADLSTAGVPGGSMTFRNADTVLVTVAVDATGQASYSVMLGAGLASLTATYNGDTSFAASASAMLPMTVTQPTHGDSGGGHSAAPPRPVAAPVAPGFAGGGLAPVVTVASAPVGSPPVAAAAASGVTAEAPIRVTTVLPPPLIARQADPQQADPRQADPATLGWSTAVTDGLRIEVQTDTAALVTGSTIDARQVSLGGGNAEPLSAPIEVRLIARDLASGTEVALPDATPAQTLSISLPVLVETLAAGDTFTWLVEVREDGQFLGYMRYPSTLDALTGMLVYDIPATTLQQSSVLPVILHPASVQTFVADVHVYSSPLRSAEDFGVVGEVWSTFDVIAPQVGGRIGVRLPATDELVWIDADGVGPSGEGITV